MVLKSPNADVSALFKIDDEASMVLIGSVFTTRQQPMNEIANKILESLTYLKFQPKTSGHFSICCCQSKLLFCFIFASMSSENHFCKITKNILIISEKEMVKCLIFNHRVSSSKHDSTKCKYPIL